MLSLRRVEMWRCLESESLDMFYLCPVNTVHTLRRIPVCSYDWEVVVVTFDTVLYCTVLYGGGNL